MNRRQFVLLLLIELAILILCILMPVFTAGNPQIALALSCAAGGLWGILLGFIDDKFKLFE